jgi:competence protein ComEA
MDGLDIDRRTMLLLLAVLVGAVGATWFVMGRGAGVPTPVTATAPVTVVASPSASPSPSSTAEVVVEVVGRVRRPAVVTLPAGSRVFDALEAVGGARNGVDTTDQNLARELVDGEQIRIGLDSAPQVVATPGAEPSDGPVDINTAPLDVLERLPGVGPVLAERIVTYREQNGGFAAVEQLLEVSGIGEATFAQMEPLVTVGAGG